MKGKITNDHINRTITISIEPGSVPDLEVTREWQKKAVVIRPDEAAVHLENGELRWIEVWGGKLKQNGRPGEAQAHRRWYTYEVAGNAPEWVRDIPGRIAADETEWS